MPFFPREAQSGFSVVIGVTQVLMMPGFPSSCDVDIERGYGSSKEPKVRGYGA